MAITREDIQRELARRRGLIHGPIQESPQEQSTPTTTETQAQEEPGLGMKIVNTLNTVGQPEFLSNVADVAPDVGAALVPSFEQAENVLPAAGEIIGGTLGLKTGPAAPVATPAFAAAGAGIGRGISETISRWLQGEPITIQDIGQPAVEEAMLSAFPEVATQVGKAAMRAGKFGKQAIQRAQFKDIASRVRAEAGEVFQPPDKDLVRGLFKQVGDSGVRVDVDPIRRHLGSVGDRYDPLLKEVRFIDNKLKTGGEFMNLMGRIQAGQRGAYDIGRLQDFRSAINDHLRRSPNMLHEAEKTLEGFADAIDDAIFNGLARGQQAATAPSVRNMLRVAREGWARILRTEDLQKMVESNIRSDNIGTGIRVSLGTLQDQIRKGSGREGRRILKSFEHAPTQRKEFMDFLDRLRLESDTLSVSLADVPVPYLGEIMTKIGDNLAVIYSSAAGREMFEELMVNNRGRFTHSSLANLANVARRELDAVQEERRPDLTPTGVTNTIQ